MHIWIIMDGNRRWATNRWLIKMIGHEKWSDNIENIIETALQNNIEFLSLWVLAKKNIEERETKELNHLYNILKTKIPEILPKLLENWIKFEVVWDLNLLPKDVQDIVINSESQTKNWTKMTLIFGLGYWWQDEIIRWIKKLILENIEQIKNSNINDFLNEINEKEFLKYIETGNFPPPDLIIRTGWDCRLSWYFLYQSEYSEYYFTDTFWPDFWEEEFKKAISKLQKAKRNFGK